MHLTLIALVFVVIFVAELPDKSLLGSLVLGSRFPGWWVWLGAASAFLIHVTVAVTAGKLLSYLPHRLLETIIAGLFLTGAALISFGKHGFENPPDHSKVSDSASFLKVFGTAFGVVFVGEWGDITQITTANYAAKYHDPWSVGIGALLGLWAVTGLVIVVGRKALTIVPPKVLQSITVSVLLIFAILSLRVAI